MSELLHPESIDRVGALAVRRLGGRIGGEVLDLKLSGALAPGTVDDLQQALVKHKVLFFRDQAQLDDSGHEAFGARLGTTVAHPTVPAPEGTKFLELDASKGGGRADSWHTDVTFVAAFPKISILRGVTIPAYGGDTVWANTAAAYEELPEPLKRLAESLWALHSNDYDYAAQRGNVAEHRLKHHREVFTAAVYETEHPLVHVHPVSGERALLIGHFIRRILGLSATESANLLEQLHRRATRPENTVRWRWRQHDVAIWDNRATMHYAVNDYGDQKRLVRRVTIAGEPAVAVDGRRSRAVKAPRTPDEVRAVLAMV